MVKLRLTHISSQCVVCRFLFSRLFVFVFTTNTAHINGSTSRFHIFHCIKVNLVCPSINLVKLDSVK